MFIKNVIDSVSVKKKHSLVVATFLLAAMGSGNAGAAVIDFGSLAGSNGAAFPAVYSEDAFEVACTLGACQQGQIYGNALPSVFSGSDIAALTVTGGLFTFSSVDLSGNNGDIEYTISASLGGSQVYQLINSLAGTFGPFSFTTLFNLNNAVIDSLLIQVSGPNTTTFNWDNIVVNSVSDVPLPAALPLLAAGLGAMGFMGWRRKRNALR